MNKTIDVTIVGAGLTGLTLAFYLKKKGKKVLIIDKNKEVGGVINTVHANGFTFETGPNTGTLSTPELVTLFKDLEGKCELVVANPDSKKRWIWKGSDWYSLPSGLLGGIKTPLFSWYDKFRILGEPFRKKGSDPFESVADLVRRRLGKSYLNYAVDPFVSGIYAGDPETLVTRFALPKLYDLEQKYGSFIGGAIKKGNEPKSEIEKHVTREVFSVKGGLKNLVNALGGSLDDDSKLLGVENLSITPQEGKTYLVSGRDAAGKAFKSISENVVTTTGAYALNELLPFLSEKELAPISSLKYAKVVQLSAGYKTWGGKKLDAFGALVPSRETPNVLGILFPASIFPDRAPKDGTLLSVFMGGVKNSAMFEMSDDEIRNIALNEIKNTLGESKQPDSIKICRYPKAIAQYEKDSEKRVQRIDELQKQYPGLILAGNIRDGIGMSDRVRQAVEIAKQLS